MEAKVFQAEKVTEDCICWIREWFEENGRGCSAVVGISGGKDSSLVAALCARALGAERVIGVLMPEGTQKDIDAAHLLCRHLGIESLVINIGEAVRQVKNAVTTALGQELSSQSVINLPPRIRMSVLYAVSQTRNGRVANTCNLSEDWVGYSTRYGDAAGDFSPLAHLTVQEIKQMGRVLGLPPELIEKVPSDGLTGKSDEENLGFTYQELDQYIREGVIEDPAHRERIDALHQRNLFKLRPIPFFPYEG